VNLGLPSGSGVSVVGRYAFYEKKIASGGMATVHLGRLLGQVGFARTVAIKRLHPHLASDPDLVSMFIDEARLAARVRHPNVVPTLDVVATPGEVFLVMEYVAGESLARLLRTGPPPLPIVAAIMAGVLYGLDAAHEAKSEQGEPLGIIHRDVSPQNVLVGVDGVAKLLDFGVAKADGRLQETQNGQVKGKLSYLAPEQLRGGSISRQVDVYAAGVVLWESITGRRLFIADNEGAVITKILEGRIPLLSRITASNVTTTLSDRAFRGLERLEWIALRALDRDPSNRFATAREMAREIERALPPATPSEVGEWVERTAHDVLATRASLVAEIESRSSLPEAEDGGSLAATLPIGATRAELPDETMRDHRPKPRAAGPGPASSPASSVAADVLAQSVRGRALPSAPPALASSTQMPVGAPAARVAEHDAGPAAPAPPGSWIAMAAHDQGAHAWSPAGTAQAPAQRGSPPPMMAAPAVSSPTATLVMASAPPRGSPPPMAPAPAPPDSMPAGADAWSASRRWVVGMMCGLAGAACVVALFVVAIHRRSSRPHVSALVSSAPSSAVAPATSGSPASEPRNDQGR